ncbi:MAG: creatininase family protein [Gemmatimonadota bacterium]|nr:creatininase family protein [Gemmatimonadota bacterium]MDH4349844.1 creatininase family protein [Gemmatimonadota bacterium]MDH5196496.1 creatininase family protein [Gemmatimonadota bacterium]
MPVGTTEQHGPHLPLGADTILIDRLADDLSAEFGILRAPTVEYGVNASTRASYPGNASVRRKTLHRFMNDLVGSWEEGGVEGFIILTAHGHDPHQEALSTLRTIRATIRTVDIFTVRLEGEDARLPSHGGALDTSLLLYLDANLVDLDLAEDYVPLPSRVRAWRKLARRSIPPEGPGSVGRPTRSSVETGERLYEFIFERIASGIFGRPARPLRTPRV